jgi:hypothetical protein
MGGSPQLAGCLHREIAQNRVNIYAERGRFSGEDRGALDSKGHFRDKLFKSNLLLLCAERRVSKKGGASSPVHTSDSGRSGRVANASRKEYLYGREVSPMSPDAESNPPLKHKAPCP